MAMSVDFTYDDGQDGRGRPCGINKVIVNWTSASDGSASGTTRKIVGSLIKGVTDPGETAPTDNYDIVITDEEGADVLEATVTQRNLTNRDTANTEQAYFMLLDAAGTALAQSLFPVVCDKLTITISNAGDSKTGQLVLYYAPLGV